MTVADDELARIGSVLEEPDRQAAPTRDPLTDLIEVAYALVEALQPIIAIVIKLG